MQLGSQRFPTFTIGANCWRCDMLRQAQDALKDINELAGEDRLGKPIVMKRLTMIAQ
jgi:hypothetical protein